MHGIVRAKCSDSRISPFLAIAVTLALIATPAGEARAQGLLDFFFGSRQPAPPPAPPPTPTPEPSRAPLATSPGGGGSHAYCVRLCDGRFFPVQQSTTTPEKLCNMLCPASQTKVFYGGEIDHAVGRDGSRYVGLASAYLFRKKEIANCTCNGRDAFGLAPIDVASDPTLRRGDTIVRPDANATAGAPAPSR